MSHNVSSNNIIVHLHCKHIETEFPYLSIAITSCIFDQCKTSRIFAVLDAYVYYYSSKFVYLQIAEYEKPHGSAVSMVLVLVTREYVVIVFIF